MLKETNYIELELYKVFFTMQRWVLHKQNFKTNVRGILQILEFIFVLKPINHVLYSLLLPLLLFLFKMICNYFLSAQFDVMNQFLFEVNTHSYLVGC